ncbi:MAG: hypothetical protein JNM01_12490 [Delftia acidovorans]|nr:hypothetical protein [Delftia acidovorans]
MHLRTNRTKWVLFLGSSSEPENRHIFDLSYGLSCLENNGIKPEDIEIYVDGANRSNIENLIHIGTTNRYPVRVSQDFFDSAVNNNHDNLVIFFSGHGYHLGIDAVNPITPHKLLTRLKGTPNLKQSVVFLGQCYAGIFNYIGAGRKPEERVDAVLIGATGLHTSLSSQTTETFPNGIDIPWLANVFLLFAFKWFLNPVDIDGDGRFSIMDCYKFAGCMANNFNKTCRRNSFEHSISAREKYFQATALVQQMQGITGLQPGELSLKQLELQSAESIYMQSFDVYHTHQESWILNSIPAQHIEF